MIDPNVATFYEVFADGESKGKFTENNAPRAARRWADTLRNTNLYKKIQVFHVTQELKYQLTC